MQNPRATISGRTNPFSTNFQGPRNNRFDSDPAIRILCGQFHENLRDLLMRAFFNRGVVVVSGLNSNIYDSLSVTALCLKWVRLLNDSIVRG